MIEEKKIDADVEEREPELDHEVLKTLHSDYYQNYTHFSEAFGKTFALYIVVITTFFSYFLSKEQALAPPLLLFCVATAIMSTFVLERLVSALRRWVDALELISECLDPLIFKRLGLREHFRAWKRFLVWLKAIVIVVGLVVLVTLLWATDLGGGSPNG